MQAGTEGNRELQEETESEVGLKDGGEETETAESTDTESSEPANESARETVARLIQEERSKQEDPGAEGGDQKKLEEDEEEEPELKRGPGRPPKEDIAPPQHFTAKEKEDFMRLPLRQKRAVDRVMQSQQAHFSRVTQEYARATNEARSVLEAIQPYASKWAERGFTPSAAIVALAAAQERLTDPNTGYSAWLQLGQEMGLDVSALQPNQGQGANGGGQFPDISRHPQFLALQQQLQQVQSYQDNARQAQFAESVNSITSELLEVKNEVDAFGRYTWPELHDDNFVESVKPLVGSIAGTVPGITYGDALRRAVLTYRGNSSAPQSPRLPAERRVAPSGAISVRGKSAPVQTTGANEIPPEAYQGSARDTVRWAFNSLRGK